MHLPTLKSKRLNLRRFKRSDISAIQKNANDKIISQFIPDIPYPYTLENARKWINLTHRKAKSKEAYYFGVTFDNNDEIAGMMGLKNINFNDMNAEVEYWMGNKFRRCGYTSEALGRLLNFAFNDLKLERVYAIVGENNISSVKLLEKNNFIREGTWRRAFRFDNKYFNVYGYGILKDEYKKNQAISGLSIAYG